MQFNLSFNAFHPARRFVHLRAAVLPAAANSFNIGGFYNLCSWICTFGCPALAFRHPYGGQIIMNAGFNLRLLLDKGNQHQSNQQFLPKSSLRNAGNA